MIWLRRIVGISRPRFWMYLIGPYLLGITAASPHYTSASLATFLAFALYFTFPANLMVYGVNDICDYETDRLNPKKSGYELLVGPDERRPLLAAILVSSLPFAILLAFANPKSWAYMAGFVTLSVFYSCPPIRAKARPVIDSAFNILYAMPGFFAYVLAGGGTPSWRIVAASMCWTMAMHAYSAVPDIASDRSAKLGTIATLLDARPTIILCLVLYVSAAILAFKALGFMALFLGVVYAALMLRSLKEDTASGVMAIYRRFPPINTVCGFVIFLTVFISQRLRM